MSRVLLFAITAIFFSLSAFSEPVKDSEFGAPRLKIGIISDIHVRSVGVDGGGWGNTDTFEKTLTWFREQGVDGVLITGDMAETGMQDQLRRVSEAWYRIFPKDKGKDGKKVEKLFVFGNHDIESLDYVINHRGDTPIEFIEANCIPMHKEKIWEECFHEKYTPFWIKNVKGYIFIGAHYQKSGHLIGFEEFMDSVKTKLPSGKKPFFYAQHMHLQGTCSGKWVWGQDDGRVTKYLSDYPNAVAFSGHSHTAFTDERTIWQGAFTSVGTGSLRFESLIGGHENFQQAGENEKGRAMPGFGLGDGRAGMLMTVYDDYIVLAKRDFVYDDYLGDDWVIPLGDNNKYSFETRYATEIAPQFPEGSSIKLKREMRKNRAGNEIDAVVLSFPSVLKMNAGIRAFDYEVTAYTLDEFGMGKRVITQRRVYSPGCYKAESQDTADVEMVFDWKELTGVVDTIASQAAFYFEVRPCGAFNAKGEPLSIIYKVN